MYKKLLLMVVGLSTALTSCLGPDDSVYTRDLDVVYSQKKDGYDFNSGSHDVKKSFFVVSDTVIYIDEKGNDYKIPGDDVDEISDADAAALVSTTMHNMVQLGWTELDKTTTPTEEQLKGAVFLTITASRTKYVGGGYYPGYPGWGYPGYPGWGWTPWIPYYYSYETASVIVSMVEPLLETTPNGTPVGTLVWESFLSGYLTTSFDLQLVLNGINQGFDQSSSYLERK